MKNKKGFTLTEILVVLALIAIILVVAIPSIMGVTRSIRVRELETKKKILISSAETYARNNESLFGSSSIIKIPVRTLVYYGYSDIDANDSHKNCNETIGCVINPTNDTSMNDDIITIKKIKSIFQAEYGDVETPNVIYATFHANGATIKNAANDYIKLSCEVYSGSTCTLTNIPTIERTGYEIDGWNLSPAGTSGRLGSIEFSNDVDYYAITHKNVTVTFDSNGGSFVSGSSTSGTCSYYNTNSNCSISNNPDATRTGYSYQSSSKWNTKSDGTGNIIDLSSVSDSAIAYINWNPNTYTVVYNKNNTSATGTTASSTHTYGVSKALTSNGYSLSGYAFNGWNTKSDGTGTSYSDGQSVSNLSSTNGATIDLYAQWKSDNYTVYYRWDGKLTHYVEGRSCPQRCVLECQKMPNKFTHNNVTYDLKCMSNGDYNDAEKEYMHTFISGFMFHKVYGSYNPYECTRNCNDNPNNYGTCTYFTIQFGKVRNVFYQYSCTIIPN